MLYKRPGIHNKVTDYETCYLTKQAHQRGKDHLLKIVVANFAAARALRTCFGTVALPKPTVKKLANVRCPVIRTHLDFDVSTLENIE
jgi:hypothetical protein